MINNNNELSNISKIYKVIYKLEQRNTYLLKELGSDAWEEEIDKLFTCNCIHNNRGMEIVY